MKHFLLSIYLLILSACQPSSTSVKDLASYATNPNNGLTQTTIKDNWIYELQYIPLELQALRSLNKKEWNDSNFQKAKEQVSGHHYLTLNITNAGGNIQKAIRQKVGEQNFQKAWTQFQFHNENAFQLIMGEWTLPCVLYHLEQNPLSHKSIKLVLVFRDNSTRSQGIPIYHNLNFQFKDQILSGKTIQITIPKKALKNIPTLKI